MKLIDFDGKRAGIQVRYQHHWNQEVLSAEFHIGGDILDIHWDSPKTKNEFARELWKRSCFELFLLESGGSYIEWNLSSSGDWACYEFGSYRQLKRECTELRPLHSEMIGKDNRVCFRFQIPVQNIYFKFQPSAIFFHRDASHSYWAPSHNLSKPDFHDSSQYLKFDSYCS